MFMPLRSATVRLGELRERHLYKQMRLIRPTHRQRVKFLIRSLQIILVTHDVKQTIVTLEQFGALRHTLQVALAKVGVKNQLGMWNATRY